MRIIPMPADDDEFNDDDPAVRLLDWKDTPETVIEAIDDLLKPFGLEVVQFDTKADYHLLKIEKLGGKGEA